MSVYRTIGPTLVFTYVKNKGTDQLHSNCAADQHLCFRYIDSTIPSVKILNFKSLTMFCGCKALFVLVLVGNPKDSFSHDTALIVITLLTLMSGILMAWFMSFSLPMVAPVHVTKNRVPTLRQLDSVTITRIHGGQPPASSVKMYKCCHTKLCGVQN